MSSQRLFPSRSLHVLTAVALLALLAGLLAVRSLAQGAAAGTATPAGPGRESQAGLVNRMPDGSKRLSRR